MKHGPILCALLASLQLSAFADERQPNVDRLSEALGPALAIAGAAVAGHDEGLQVTRVDSAESATEETPEEAAGPPKASLRIEFASGGPARYLLVDSNLVFGDAKSRWVPRPGQLIPIRSSKTVEVELLPLRPTTLEGPSGQLSVSPTAPALTAILRAIQAVETVDTVRMERFLIPEGDGYLIQRSDSPYGRLAAYMTWSRGPKGKPLGRLKPGIARLAIWAVTAQFTVNEAADWLRDAQHLTGEQALARSLAYAGPVEFLLERAGLNHRIYGPNHADYHLRRGLIAFREGRLKPAQEHFRKARTKAVTGDWRPQYNRGIALYRMGQHQQARGEFTIASGLVGAPSQVFYNKGAAAFRLGDKRSATFAFLGVLKLEPNNADAAAWLERSDPEKRYRPKPKPVKKKRKRRRRRRKRSKRKRR